MVRRRLYRAAGATVGGCLDVRAPSTPACPRTSRHEGSTTSRSDLDRYQLLALLRDVAKEIEWQVLSWCLMTTHYHGHRTIGYILDNPVRAGMVKRFDEWPWSGLETLRPRDELGTLASSSRHILVRLGG